MLTMTAPDRSEFADYYSTYINQVPAGDIKEILETQGDDYIALLSGIAESRSLHRYEAGKWSIREVAAHVNDAERVFTYRALWFARGYDSPLPSFDQDIAIATCNADARTLASHFEEFRAIRAATVALFHSLPDEAWTRTGIASGNQVSVRALAYIVCGHSAHHGRIVRERYLQ